MGCDADHVLEGQSGAEIMDHDALYSTALYSADLYRAALYSTDLYRAW
ncbi:hypothetical protein FACS189472_03310 [Alphaproteobacteria bacterium]|nr:hypothetical protein FACS189472_03310 [Alphaproteobacteria bacterium]